MLQNTFARFSTHFTRSSRALALLLLGAGSLQAGTPAVPFGSHLFTYASHIKPSSVTLAQLETATKTFYDNWRNAYLLAGCTAGHYRINYDGANQTVSEAHGYGMLVFALMAGYDANAKTYFDGMYQYYKAHPSSAHNRLMAWQQNSSCANINGPDSATDGDLDIAMSLLMADRQWGSCGAINYKAEGVAMINQIKAYDCDASVRYVKLGDWATSGNYLNSTRSSDFMPSHYRSYQWATGDTAWTGLINHTYYIVTATANATTGLLPDFIANPITGPVPAPGNFLESPDDGNYNWNACRDPWRIATDYLASGDSRAYAEAQKMATWLKGAPVSGNPNNVRAGYQLNGTQLVAYGDRAFTVPFAVAAMVDASNQTLLNTFWGNAQVGGTAVADYFGDSIKMLCMIVISGNWWQPEAMADPCALGSPTFTSTPSRSATPTATRSNTPQATASASPTRSFTSLATATRSNTPMATASNTQAASATATPTRSSTPLTSATSSPTSSFTTQATFTRSHTPSATATASSSPLATSTRSNTPAASPTPSSTPPPAASCKIVLAYYTSWNGAYKADKIPYSKLTHICHAFIWPNADGSLANTAAVNEPALLTNAHAAGVKVLISVGGATGSGNFAAVANSAAIRATFVANLKNFVLTRGYDGVDFDWEFPLNATDRGNFTLLVQDIRTAFNSAPNAHPEWLVSGAYSWTSWYAQWYDLAALTPLVDFFNVMTYDAHGPWSPHSGHNAPLAAATGDSDAVSMQATINYYNVTRGVPLNKLVFGVPFYGYDFPTEDLHQACACDNSNTFTYPYQTIVGLIGAGWTYSWDASASSPKLRSDSSARVISYDDPTSIQMKADWALNTKNMAGVFMWDLSNDYLGPNNQPLLDAMRAPLGCVATATPSPAGSASSTPSATRSATLSATRSATPSATRSATLAATASATPAASSSPTQASSSTPSAQPSATATAPGSFTPSPVYSLTQAGTPSQSPTLAASATATSLATQTATSPATQTSLPSATPSTAATLSATQAATSTATAQPTATRSATAAPSNTAVSTATRSASATPTFVSSATRSATPSPSSQASSSATATSSATPWPLTSTPTRTATASASPSPAPSSAAPLLLQAWPVPNPQSGPKTTLAFQYQGQISELTLTLYTKGMTRVLVAKAQGSWWGPAWGWVSFETPGLARGFYWYKLSASGPAGTANLEKIGTLYRLD